MMPYYLIYLPVIAATTFFLSGQPRSLKSFIAFINLPLQITSGVLGVGIGALTWLRGSPTFQRDPWLIINPLIDSLTVVHVLGGVILLALIVITIRYGRTDPRGPVILFVVMGALALLFALLSLVQSYWILPRQFVASQAIMTIAVVWGVGLALKASPQTPKRILSGIFAILILFGAGRATAQQVENLLDWENNGFPAAGNPGDAAFHGIDVGPANQNVSEGGPVWPELTVFYDQPKYGPGEDPNSP